MRGISGVCVRVTSNGQSAVFHDSKKACAILAEYCNTLAEKLDEVVNEVNSLRSEIARMKGEPE